MITQYTLTGKVVNIAKFKIEIQESPDILIAIDSISGSSTTVNVFFKDALSSPEETALNALHTAHDPTPNSETPVPTTAQGIPIVAPRWADIESLVGQWEDKRVTFTAGTPEEDTTSSDYIPIVFASGATEMKLAAGMYWIDNPSDVHEEDYIVVNVVAKANAVPDGQGGYLPENTVLKTLITHWYIKKGDPNGGYFYKFKPEHGGVSDMSEAFKFEVEYHSFGGVAIKMVYGLNYYQG